VESAIARLELDLRGRTIVTEAASGPFVVSPVIAAMAGAERVIALTRASRYASVDQVIAQTRALEALCGAAGSVDIRATRSPELFAAADLVTNLGFVRPLDRATIEQMRPGAVIALMCEAWEYRPGDVDLEACRGRGIEVFGTNEDFPGVEVFAYSAWVAAQLLLEAQIELHKSRIAVIGTDKFGEVIVRRLAAGGIAATLHPRLEAEVASRADAILVADYSRREEIIGERGDMTAAALARANSAVTVVQFAGALDVRGLQEAGLDVYPAIDLPPRRMARTLAALGARPVVELHAAGFKVGQLALEGAPGASHRFAALLQKLN
jgi:hypothetical protein